MRILNNDILWCDPIFLSRYLACVLLLLQYEEKVDFLLIKVLNCKNHIHCTPPASNVSKIVAYYHYYSAIFYQGWASRATRGKI